MGQLQVKCPHCGTLLEVEAGQAGQTVACPQCGGSLQIGLPEAAPAPASAVPNQLPERMKANRAVLGRTCSFCRQPVELGQEVFNCRNCGQTMHQFCQQKAGGCTSSQCAGAAPPPETSLFPERMKANRALMGRACSSCSQPIELGQDVFNCQTCGQTMHQACHERAGGCMNAHCPNSALKPSAPPAAVAGAAVAPGALPRAEEVECKFCGERILKNARKCRHCGELQNAAARAADARRKREAAADENLTTGEIVFGIICGGIACILGLVWGIEGKKKGWKLVAIAVVSQIVFGMIRVLIEASRN